MCNWSSNSLSSRDNEAIIKDLIVFRVWTSLSYAFCTVLSRGKFGDKLRFCFLIPDNRY